MTQLFLSIKRICVYYCIICFFFRNDRTEVKLVTAKSRGTKFGLIRYEFSQVKETKYNRNYKLLNPNERNTGFCRMVTCYKILYSIQRTQYQVHGV